MKLDEKTPMGTKVTFVQNNCPTVSSTPQQMLGKTGTLTGHRETKHGLRADVLGEDNVRHNGINYQWLANAALGHSN